MTDRLSIIEQGQASQAEFLDQIAQALRVLEDRSAAMQRDEFEARLAPSWPVRTGEAGAGGLGARSDVGRSLGNTEPYTGRVNAVSDPTFEAWPKFPTTQSLLTVDLNLGPYWHAFYVLNSGTAPSFLTIFAEQRNADDAPLNSNTGRIQLDWGATTGSVTLVVRSVRADLMTVLPFLIGALRFVRPIVTTAADFTLSAVVRLLDTSNVVVATSPAFDLQDLGADLGDFGGGDTIRLHAAEPVDPGTKARLLEVRITVARVATSGGAAQVSLYFGDPQIHAAYTPDPIPYAPLLGNWYPSRVEGGTVVLEEGLGTFETSIGWWRITGIAGGTEAGLALRVPGETRDRVQLVARALPPAVTLRGDGGANPNAGAEVEYQAIEIRHSSVNNYRLLKLAAVQPTGGFLDNAEFVVSTGTAGVWTEGLRVRGFPTGLVSTPHAVKALGYQVGANAVVGARRTGWTPATGTATRTTFVTSTVTLPQLAERVKALLDDLHATAGHGLIGT